MLANVLAFPAVFAVFYFVSYLLGPTTDAGKYFGITNTLNPASSQTLPLLGGLDLSFIRILLAFGALLATPSIPDIVQRAIGKASQAGQLIGQEIGADTRAGQGYFGQAQSNVGRTAGRFSDLANTWYGQPPAGRSVAGEIETARGRELPGILRPRWRP
jgi:hypothetical protein